MHNLMRCAESENCSNAVLIFLLILSEMRWHYNFLFHHVLKSNHHFTRDTLKIALQTQNKHDDDASRLQQSSYTS
jgi:hypothetical protein